MDKINDIKEKLGKYHDDIQPPLGWDKLRKEIDDKITNSGNLYGNRSTLVFWRRTSMALAACLFLAAGILLYYIGFNQGILKEKQISQSQNLFSERQIDKLITTFSQVYKLFGNQSRWVMLGPNDSSQIGVEDIESKSSDYLNKLVFVRLAVDVGNGSRQVQYYDLVTLPDQLVSFQLPINGGKSVNLGLKPLVEKNGSVILNIHAAVNGSGESNRTAELSGGAFTNLVRIQEEDKWINIEGAGRSLIPKI